MGWLGWSRDSSVQINYLHVIINTYDSVLIDINSMRKPI